MLSVVQHDQDIFNHLHSVVTENPHIWSDSFSSDRQIDLSERYCCPDISCFPWVPLGNTLGLFDMHESECVPASELELIPPVSTTTTSSSFNTLFSHQPPSVNNLVHYGQPSASHNPFVYQEPAFTSISIQETHAPLLNHAVSPQEDRFVPKPTLRSRRDRCRGSRVLPRSSSVHSRYALSDDAQHRESSMHCQWTDGGIHLCGATVVGTKAEIGRHLREAHAIQLNPNRIMQNCMWETCRKSMRRESIPRHILTVHFHDKVRCPGCKTHFARKDSLQRHQRLCRKKAS